MSIHCRPRVDRCFGQASTDVGRRIDHDHIGRLSVNYRRDIGQLSAKMSTNTMVLIDISADTWLIVPVDIDWPSIGQHNE